MPTDATAPTDPTATPSETDPATPENEQAAEQEGRAGVGQEVELVIERVAHGGHCVARHEGRVVFVHHTLPGEQVRARLTDAAPEAKFWRADAVDVLEASPDRVASAWPAAGPGGVGGESSRTSLSTRSAAGRRASSASSSSASADRTTSTAGSPT
ncbi:TRAM domain-containing protein [Paraoerskovia sediminicola]|uniref:TRAM domain-containing protein n=1 Tax=Paraoerskovia sediminicola TaxID=1138587 RepID=UPI0033066825